MMDRRFEGALGIFDSGVGGLTVVNALLKRYPDERVLYVADQAHVPYGGRPLDEVCGFAGGISQFLAEQGCRAVIMACNISSATALATVVNHLSPIPVLGVIAPAAARALMVSQELSPAIGVLATDGTVRSGAYTASLVSLNPNCTVTEVGCPKFVPLIEAGQVDTLEAESAVREYLAPLVNAGCHTIILGCTHYPFLLPLLTRISKQMFDKPVTFVDPADEMADALFEVLPDAGNPRNASRSETSLLLTTGNADIFECQAPRFLAGFNLPTGCVRWDNDILAFSSKT